MSTTIATPPPTQTPASEDISSAEIGAAVVPQRGLRLAHLWAILPVAIAWFATSISFIEPYDIWWNIKSGQLMAQCGRWDFSCFLGSDVLVWTPVRLPYSNPQWGSQLIFYWLYSASPYLLLTARTLIIATTTAILVWLCFQRSKSLRLACMVTLLVLFTGWTNYGMRPQLLAFLPFIAFFFLLENKDAHPRWLLLLTPIMIFWVNIHGSFFLGVALMGIYALGAIFEKLTNSDGRRWLVSKAAAWQLGCFIAAALATLANPYITGIYSYFFIATNDPIARAFNIEWQAPTIYDGTGILFYSNLAIFLASAYLSKRRMRPTEILLVLAFGYLALTSIRNVLWWGWVTAPIMAANFATFTASRAIRHAELGTQNSKLKTQNLSSPRRVELPVLNWILAIILLGSALAFTPLWRPINPLVPAAQKHALADNTPTKLADFIKQTRPPAPLFSYMEWGGYLEWELYPQYKLFIDGRFEAREVQVWKDYLAVSRARADWQKILDSYHVNTLILNKDFHADLIRAIETSPTWRRIYDDKMGKVFVRK
jgi:hypothetical protein